MEAPAWIPLFEEGRLAEILSRAEGQHSSEQARILYEIFGAELYAAIWQPLEAALAGVKTVYYSPSGLLHKIAFNALPADSGRLADQYDLNLVSSTREVVYFAKNNAEAAPVAAVVYGGIDYDTEAGLMRLAAQEMLKDGVEIAATPDTAVAAVLSAERTRGARGGVWSPLPATRIEARSIQGYLRESRVAAALFEDSYGNEESFKQLDGAKTALIHLATHGFFLTDLERDYEEEERMRQMGEMVPKVRDNPLLRSGLVLSGGNHAWTGAPVEGVEDGILTADEIARLNLVGARLVILSACQTALGDVNNSEGVFGLQRAFKLAGVESLIMSLWEVDDNATAKLMNAFYGEWLIKGKSKQAAFKEAQRQVRVEYPAPYYWAAFVMMD
jgi:CHAT domain-containing protein